MPTPDRTSPPPARAPRLFALGLAFTLAACDESVGPIDPIDPPDPVPATIAVASGGDQRALPLRTLHHPVVVRVLDAQSRPLSGYGVTFSPGAGHGAADPAVVTTDAAGEAATIWTLGADPGTHTLAVAATEASHTVTATALDLEAELDSLFQPPTDPERDAVRADWAGRDISAQGVREEFSGPLDLAGSTATLRVVSHTVGGVRHYGGIIAPPGADARDDGSLPILSYLHGGDGGVSIADIQVAALALGEFRDSFVYVIPSFRGEPFVHGDSVWMSEGPESPWDYDVDDALALINVAIGTTPVARPDSIHLLGGSRGAGVALLAGARDRRISRIVALFGPTWFFDDWVRGIVRDAALGSPPDLPGVAHLDSTVVQPHIRGEMSRSQGRLELVRRSSALFAADLPSVQLHHGDIDQVVAVSQAHAMMDAMTAAGRTAPDFEAFIYEGAGHNLLSLADAIPRAVEFLSRGFGGKSTSPASGEGEAVTEFGDERRPLARRPAGDRQ